MTSRSYHTYIPYIHKTIMETYGEIIESLTYNFAFENKFATHVMITTISSNGFRPYSPMKNSSFTFLHIDDRYGICTSYNTPFNRKQHLS